MAQNRLPFSPLLTVLIHQGRFQHHHSGILVNHDIPLSASRVNQGLEIGGESQVIASQQVDFLSGKIVPGDSHQVFVDGGHGSVGAYQLLNLFVLRPVFKHFQKFPHPLFGVNGLDKSGKLLPAAPGHHPGNILHSRS